MYLETLGTRWNKARTTNTTATSFSTRSPTGTEPTGIGDAAAQTTSAVYNLTRNSGGATQNLVVVKPFGAGSDTNTMSMRVIGWTLVPGVPGTTTDVWDPTTIVEVACALTTVTGVAGGIVTTTDRFVDTITKTYPTDTTGLLQIHSNAADLAAFFVVDLIGFTKVEFSFSTGSSATSCNALWRFI